MSSFEKLLICVGLVFGFSLVGLVAGYMVGLSLMEAEARSAPPGAGHGVGYAMAGELVGSIVVGVCVGAVVGAAVGVWCVRRRPTPGPGTG